MENLDEIVGRVERYLPGRLTRLAHFIATVCTEPRKARGVRHSLAQCVLALLAGLLGDRKSLRDVEALSQRMGLGRRGDGVSDGALSHLLSLCGPDHFDGVLAASVKDMRRRGELKHPHFAHDWVAIDGKYSTLDHHCGGWGQMFHKPDGRGVYWRVGVLRAVLITSPGRTALGQLAMGPVRTDEKDPEKIKHTGEITNLPAFIGKLRRLYGDLVSNFTLDAGLWSRATFLAMDVAGYGMLCALKDNKPELHDETARVLRIEMARNSAQAESDWEVAKGGTRIRRRLWRTTRLDGWMGWKNLRQAVVVEQTTRDKDGNETVELRYFVTNATTGMLSPLQLLRLIRQHWAIENDCNWTFDMQFGEDDLRWCAQNTAILALGALRMVAYNIMQRLRKCHVMVQRKNAADTPRPWRQMAEFVLDYLKNLSREIVSTLAKTTPRPVRPVACLSG